MNIDISDLAEKYAGLNFEDEDIEIDLPAGTTPLRSGPGQMGRAVKPETPGAIKSRKTCKRSEERRGGQADKMKTPILAQNLTEKEFPMTNINPLLVAAYFNNEDSVVGVTVDSSIPGRSFYITRKRLYLCDPQTQKYSGSAFWDINTLTKIMADLENWFGADECVYGPVAEWA